MKNIINRWSGLKPAAWLCWALSTGAIVQAFMGADRAGAQMRHGYMLVGVVLLALVMLYVGIRACWRRQWASSLLHLGCALVLLGWLAGRYAERQTSQERPVTGSMAMIDGEESDQIWLGPYLDEYAGRIPFKVKLEKFFVERYPRSAADRAAGREAPIREYRSRVTITRPQREPYVANIRVNQPVYVQGYYIYQMSWGQSSDRFGRPVTYTVLQFIRDPGVPVVYGGFALLVLGIVLFAARVMRGGRRGN